jgi:copper resistance protein D
MPRGPGPRPQRRALERPLGAAALLAGRPAARGEDERTGKVIKQAQPGWRPPEVGWSWSRQMGGEMLAHLEHRHLVLVEDQAELVVGEDALVEAGLGLGVLGIVAVLGILPPGLHTEPGWPLPFRLELAALGSPSAAALAVLTTLAGIFLAGGAATAAAGRYRLMAAAWGGLAICVALSALVVRPAIEPAYPTTFYAPAEPYAAASVMHGARLYAENCAFCHGTGGKGNGPAAAGLTVHPADLTAPHLFAHTPGDLFWWVSNGKGSMPGFAPVLSPPDRWDVINFVRARAAGVLSRQIGPEVATAATSAIPDFAFQAGGRQQTLYRILQNGPAVIALFSAPPSADRVTRLAAAQRRLAAVGLQIVAIALGSASSSPAETAARSPLISVPTDVSNTLALFRAPNDGEETDLLLDRAGNVRARWTASGAAGLPDVAAFVAAAARVAGFSAAPENHAGHAP